MSTPYSELRWHDDPGLQPERTSLSWNRTSISLMLVAATLVRWSSEYPVVILVLAVVMLILAVVILAAGGRRYQREAWGLAQERVEPNIAPVFLIAACMVLFGGTELVLLMSRILGG